MEACSGGILGLGEALEDRVELALTLRELGVDSVPINFLNPRPETPLADRPLLSPQEALRALAMFRLALPECDLRIAAGRELCLKELQPLALRVANSFFTEGYLTTPGQGIEADRKLVEEAGFEAEVF